MIVITVHDDDRPWGLSWSKYATNWPIGTFGFPGMTRGAVVIELANASFVCCRMISGSTNLAEVGVGGIEAPEPSVMPNPTLSTERLDCERRRRLRGVTGAGAAIPDCVG